MTRAALVAALLLAVGPALAAEPKLPELRLSYAAAWNGIKLGEIVVTLKAEGESGCYRYESLSDPVGLVRMFYGTPREISEFCVAGGKVVPKRFAFSGHGDGFTLDFDLAGGKVRDGQGQERDIPANAQDRFGLQQAVRLWVLDNLSNKEIANKLNISERTAKFHVSNLLTKYGVGRRADLILLWYQREAGHSQAVPGKPPSSIMAASAGQMRAH